MYSDMNKRESINPMMRRIFGGNAGKSSSGVPIEKDLRGLTINVNNFPVTIEKQIAEGGFSFVYVVKCNRTGRYYALKRQFVNEQRLLEACRREIEITRTLGTHANIVTYVASSLQAIPDGVHEYLLLTHYYRNSVLQLMNERLCVGRTLTVNEIVNIFCDVCSAVARLHHCQTPVIHRDLKVENLLLDSENVCVLCDFGSATTRVLSTLTHSYGMVDEEISRFTTLSYRAPEMVDLYSAVPITTKADVWALGVMLFKLCYFALPFGESALAIQNAMFTFPNDPEYPPEILALIVHMLTPDANRRPDIYQVSHAIFSIAKRDCPVKNLNNTEAPTINYLLNLLSHHRNRQKGTSEQIQNLQSNHSVKTLDNGVRLAPDNLQSTTSVKPRPRPNVAPPICSPALPLPADSYGPWKAKKTESPANDDSIASSQSLKENNDTTSANFNPSTKSASSSHGVEGHSSLPRSSEGTATATPTGNGHRRNVSDPSSALPEGGDRCSAFRPYHSQMQVSAKERSSVTSWNPFDLDDHSFGLHFDELPRRRGSASSTANVKSRESLVMMVDDADPFGSAPFTPPAVNRNNTSNHGAHRLSIDKQKIKTKKTLYEKLINSEETEVVGNNRLRPKETYETESIGSASDLQARMQVSSTSDDEEDDDDNSDVRRPDQQNRSGSRSSAEGDRHDVHDRDAANAAASTYNEPNELQGRRPLLAEDEDDGTELFEMNVLSPGSTDTMIGPQTSVGFSSVVSTGSSSGMSASTSAVHSENVFLNAPFDSASETNRALNNRFMPVGKKPKPSDLPPLLQSGAAVIARGQHKPSSAMTSSLGGAGDQKTTAFINSSFQGDDAFRS